MLPRFGLPLAAPIRTSTFRFNSQALTVAFTEQAAIGGRAWPNVIFDDKRFDCGFAAWGNSTLGLLSFWWHSNRQQSSKDEELPQSEQCLPSRCWTSARSRMSSCARQKAIFNEFRDKELKPAYLADADPNRALLDRRVVCDLLGFDEETYAGVRRLAAKWCAEPSVHGGKARPKGAALGGVRGKTACETFVNP